MARRSKVVVSLRKTTIFCCASMPQARHGIGPFTTPKLPSTVSEIILRCGQPTTDRRTQRVAVGVDAPREGWCQGLDHHLINVLHTSDHSANNFS